MSNVTAHLQFQFQTNGSEELHVRSVQAVPAWFGHFTDFFFFFLSPFEKPWAMKPYRKPVLALSHSTPCLTSKVVCSWENWVWTSMSDRSLHHRPTVLCPAATSGETEDWKKWNFVHKQFKKDIVIVFKIQLHWFVFLLWWVCIWMLFNFLLVSLY